MKSSGSESKPFQSRSKLEIPSRARTAIEIGVPNWFRRRTFHVLNSMCWVRLMKRSASEPGLKPSKLPPIETLYYYSFKIFGRFWLAKIPHIIHHNQLLSTKFARILRYWTDDVNRAEKLTDYWTVNREDLGKSLTCFGSEYRMSEHFTCFTANYCLKEQQEDNSTDDVCDLEYIWRPEQSLFS